MAKRWRAFILACLLVGLAAAFRWAVGAELGQLVFLPLCMPIAAGAWLGGFQVGMLVTVGGGLLFRYFFIPPPWSLALTQPDTIALITFLITGWFLSALVGRAYWETKPTLDPTTPLDGEENPKAMIRGEWDPHTSGKGR
jgi:K+-sensing histidine kinase KdpD